MPAPNANTKVQDGFITHTVNILRVAADERLAVMEHLLTLEEDLIGQLEDVGGKTAFQAGKLTALLKQTQATITDAYSKIDAHTGATLEKVAQLEATKTVNVINGAIGAPVAAVAMSPQQLAAIAGKTLINGKHPSEWWKDQGAQLQDSFMRQMRLGMAQGEGVDKLARRVRGTQAKGYTDGLMAISKSRAETLVRTSVLQVSNEARLATIASQHEAGIAKGVQWVSTLDSRTTPICRALDGLQWSLPDYVPIGHDKAFPGPIAHWGCRSTQTAVLRSWAELAGPKSVLKNPDGAPADLDKLIQEKLVAAGMDPEQAAQVKTRTRASMDGQVAQETDFDQWLHGKPEDFQNDLLGKARANLWREGKATLREMTDQNSNPLTLAQLHDLIAANQDTAPAKDGQDGLNLAERKLLEGSMAHGAKHGAVLTHFLDQDTGKRVTITGMTPTPAELAQIGGMGAVTVLQNTLTPGGAWDAQSLKAFAHTKGFAKAILVGPDGAVLTLNVNDRAKFTADEADNILHSIEHDHGAKSPAAAFKKAVLHSAETVNIQAKDAGTVTPPPKLFETDFPPLHTPPKPFFDPAADAAKVAATQAQEQEAAAAKAAAAAKKAAHAAAQSEITAELQGKPNSLLSKAIVVLQKNDPGLEPPELLTAAQAKVADDKAKALTAQHLAGYKKAFLAGKTPTGAQLAALDGMEEIAKGSFLQDLQTQKAHLDAMAAAQLAAAEAEALKAKLNAEAQAKIGEAIQAKSGPATLGHHLAKLMVDAPHLEPAELLDAGHAALAGAKADNLKKQHLAGAIKSMVAGKDMTPAQKAVFDAMDEAETEAFGKQVAAAIAADHAKKAAAAQAEATAQIAHSAAAAVTSSPTPNVPTNTPAQAQFPADPSKLTIIHGLGGSTGAQLVEDPATGLRYVYKKGKNPDHLREEFLADSVYRLYGVATPETRLYEGARPIKLGAFIDGTQSLVSVLSSGSAAERASIVNQVRGNFVLDALIGNWDVVGLGRDNILVKDGIAYRIDNGGSFRFRAQGELKEAKFWGPKIGDLDTMRNAKTNPQAAEIFKGITDTEIKAQAAAVLARKDELLDLMPPHLRDTMEGRLRDLAKRTGLDYDAPGPAPEPKPAPPSVPADLPAKVERARINGFTVLGDRDLIEDNTLLHWPETGKNGEPLTRVDLKVTKAGSDIILNTLGPAAKAAMASANTATVTTHPADTFSAPFLAAAKTISVHAADKAYNAATMANYEAAKAKLATMAGSKDAETVKMIAHYQAAIATIEAAKSAGKALKPGDVGAYVYTPPKAAKGAAPASSLPAGVTVTKTNLDYVEKTITNGHARQVNDIAHSVSQGSQQAFAVDFGDAQVRFIPSNGSYSSSSALALQGKVEITAKGAPSQATLARVQEIVKALGVDTAPPSDAYLELAYLRRGVALLNRGPLPAFEAIFTGSEPDDVKVAAARELVEKTYKVKLPDKWTPEYNPAGKANGWGEGFRTWERFDLPRKTVEKELSGFTLTHASRLPYDQLVESFMGTGGEATPTTGRLRKGVSVRKTGGMSPDADLGTGGASYFFTRIRQNSDSTGLHFKIGNLARTDAMTYTNDRFGSIADLNTAARKTTLADYRKIARSGSSGESNFKNGLNFLEEIDYIVPRNAAERKAIIAVFKKHGWATLPDGRPVESIVRQP